MAMGELVIATFNEQKTAGEVLKRLLKRERRDIVLVDQAVVAERDTDGRLKVRNAGNDAVGEVLRAGSLGIILGTILGGLVGSPGLGMAIGGVTAAGAGTLSWLFHDAEDEDKVLQKIQNDLPPGTSALAVVFWLPDDSHRKILLSDLEAVRGEVIETTLSAKNEEELRQQLAAHV